WNPHCIIHRQVLAAKALPDDLRDLLNMTIKVVNFIKNSTLNVALCVDLGADHKTLLFHMEVCNMLSRLFELKDEVEIFLRQQKKEELYHAFMNHTFQLSLAYPVDIFKSLNSLNLKLQGNNAENIIAHHNAIKAFKKIQLWKCQAQAQMPNFSSFLTFSALAENEGFQELCKEDAKNKIVFPLDCLADEFILYFPDNFSGNPVSKLAHNPFNVDVNSLPEVLQEQALKMKYNSSAKDNFENSSLEEFGIKYFPIYSKVGEEALHIILPFLLTYLCEKSFSSLVTLKTKQRNRLDIENNLRCALSSFKP
uniref:HAT C-terminal dimerisation domain-containing protein n=1 Tax=Pelodiscus sinensis TaxID=13735 RepID=K7GF68_PELSI